MTTTSPKPAHRRDRWKYITVALAATVLLLPLGALVSLEACPKIVIGKWRLRNYWARHPESLALPHGYSRSRMLYRRGLNGPQYPIDFWTFRVARKVYSFSRDDR